MSSVAIKICGVRRAQDIVVCADLGVSMVGFNFWPQSRRYVRAQDAARLQRECPRELRTVGVFVNASVDEIRAVLEHVRLDRLQLHGDERLEDYASLGVPLVQVIRVSGPEALMRAVSPLAHHVLLDAAVDGYGGAGKRFDWTWVAAARERLGERLLLAGGLLPDNVEDAIAHVRPWGVDVASGVEAAPGEKDPVRLRAFVEAVRRAEHRLQEVG